MLRFHQELSFLHYSYVADFTTMSPSSLSQLISRQPPHLQSDIEIRRDSTLALSSESALVHALCWLFRNWSSSSKGSTSMWSRACTQIVKANYRVRPSLRLESAIRRWLSTSSGKRFAAAWGNGDYGRLGHGGLDSQPRPKRVPSTAFGDENPKSIACGGAHTLFLTGSKSTFFCSLLNFLDKSVYSHSWGYVLIGLIRCRAQKF